MRSGTRNSGSDGYGNANNQLVPSWTNADFTLQSAPSATGPFTLQTNNLVQLQADVIPGRIYRVEYKDSLNAPGWTPLGANRTTFDPVFDVYDTVDDSPQRFYRLVLLP